AKAGALLAAEGLQPTSAGARIRYAGDKRTVVDGPFAEAKELVAGFWMIEVDSKEKAIEWLKRAPFQDGEVEIRQIFEMPDFGEALTPELQERNKALGEKISENAKR